MGNVAWICACGEKFPEDGTASAWGKIGVHVREGKKSGEDCERIGIVDSDTGEILLDVRGMSPPQSLRAAEEAGFVDPNRPKKGKSGKRKGAEEEDLVEEEGGSLDAKQPTKRAKSAASPRSNLEGVVPLLRVPLPASIYAFKALTDPYFVHDSGVPYGWTPEELGEWMQGLLEIGLNYLLHLNMPNLSNNKATDDYIQQLINAAKSTQLADFGGQIQSQLEAEIKEV